VLKSFEHYLKFLGSSGISETWSRILLLHIISFKIISRDIVMENFGVSLEALI
jgi:hypothetical protein